MSIAEISFKRQRQFEVKKTISKKQVDIIIDNLEKEMDFEIKPLIDKIISKKADCFSIRKDNPDRYLFISNGSDYISFTMRTLGKETEVSIPKNIFKG